MMTPSPHGALVFSFSLHLSARENLALSSKLKLMLTAFIVSRGQAETVCLVGTWLNINSAIYNSSNKLTKKKLTPEGKAVYSANIDT